MEEPGNQIDWDEWSVALNYFWSSETADAITEILQVIAYYDLNDQSEIKSWAEGHQLNLKDWGCRVMKDPEREELMKLLAVN